MQVNNGTVDQEDDFCFLSRELESAQLALEETERKLVLSNTSNVRGSGRRGGVGSDKKNDNSYYYFDDDDHHHHHNDHDDDGTVHDLSVQKLIQIQDATNRLELAKDVSDWVRMCTSKREDDSDNTTFFPASLSSSCFECYTLAKLLIKHSSSSTAAAASGNDNNDLYTQLLRDEYVPLHSYVRSELVLTLRDNLKALRYPSKDLCQRLLLLDEEEEDESRPDAAGRSSSIGQVRRISTCCQWIVRIDAVHRNLVGRLRNNVTAKQVLLFSDENDNNKNDGIDLIVLELCRPFVERVRYHFVSGTDIGSSGASDGRGKSSATSSRIDRLPEWLFEYLRENFFCPGGPWDFVVDGIVVETASACADSSSALAASAAVTVAAVHTNTDDDEEQEETITGSTEPVELLQKDLPVRVLNEIVRIVQHVLNERNFFRHSKISGPHSNPLLLCAAIEQMLQMDQTLQDALSEATMSVVTSPTSISQLQQQQRRRLLSLMDIFVAGDEELMYWWLERERETIFSTMFGGTAGAIESGAAATTTTNFGNISTLAVHPSAELFCALIKSIQRKTALFSFTGPYWNVVAAPFCVRFVDLIHDSVVDLKLQLAPSTRRGGAKGMLLPPSSTYDDDAPSLSASNVCEWILWINGTRLAAQTLLSQADGDTTSEQQPMATATASSSLDSVPNQDVLRFGRSLQNLDDVLVEDFAKTFVETLLLERAKMAGYLMRCSTLLMLEKKEDWIEEDDDYDFDTGGSGDGAGRHSISSDLRESARLLHRFLRICDNATLALPSEDPLGVQGNGKENDRLRRMKEISEYAPRVMRERVLVVLSEKLMEVAINFHDMSPDLFQYGCQVFSRDVEVLFGTASNLPSYTLRLLEVTTKLMALPSQELAQIGQVLCGLAGQPAPLTEASFEDDERLYDEAMSMIRAKGLVWVELEDVLSILNRRRELTSGL